MWRQCVKKLNMLIFQKEIYWDVCIYIYIYKYSWRTGSASHQATPNKAARKWAVHSPLLGGPGQCSALYKIHISPELQKHPKALGIRSSPEYILHRGRPKSSRGLAGPRSVFWSFKEPKQCAWTEDRLAQGRRLRPLVAPEHRTCPWSPLLDDGGAWCFNILTPLLQDTLPSLSKFLLAFTNFRISWKDVSLQIHEKGWQNLFFHSLLGISAWRMSRVS